jgi:hypothetical protein
MSEPNFRCSVVRLVTDDELLLDAGTQQGLLVGQIFDILDPRTENVTAPDGRNLGSLRRVKASVRIIEVGEQLALAEARRDFVGISSLSRALTGASATSKLTAKSWAEGVEVGDPAEPRPDASRPSE